jgi:hypothetical protein
MRVINVVEVVENNVVGIESFGVFEEQLSQDVVDAAEKCFTAKVREFIGGDETDEQTIEDALENGYYEDGTKGYYYVCIIWSDI